MLVLKLLRLILPPFHPLKYRWINYWWGKQGGGYWNSEDKYAHTVKDLEEFQEKKKAEKQSAKGTTRQQR